MKVLALAVIALGGAAVAGVAAHGGAGTTTVKVTEKEYRIALSVKKAPAGPVKFVVRNSGTYPHALAIAGPGLKPKRTPLIKPGRSATLTVTLRSGTYSLWCPVPGHAARGMKASFTAGGGGPATSTASSGGTTTDTIPWG